MVFPVLLFTSLSLSLFCCLSLSISLSLRLLSAPSLSLPLSLSLSLPLSLSLSLSRSLYLSGCSRRDLARPVVSVIAHLVAGLVPDGTDMLQTLSVLPVWLHVPAGRLVGLVA